LEDIADTGHRHCRAALLSCLAYLNRYGAGEEVLEPDYGAPEGEADLERMLRVCASGEGIVNLHHTITFYILTAWQNAPFNGARYAPFGILAEWTGGKEEDGGETGLVSGLELPDKLPASYEEFSESFDPSSMEHTMSRLKGLLRRDPRRCTDWLFREYAGYYDPSSWDPHFYTSLYCALKLYMEEERLGEDASLMALHQALKYLASAVLKE
jgi:hypothetical protein